MKRRCVKCQEETERGHKAKAPVQAGDPAVEVAGKVAVMEQARAETVFVQTAGKESPIN